MNGLEAVNETEQKKHLQSVENLFEALDISRERIVAAYEQELSMMGRMARVRDYLPILVSRRVKRKLHQG